MWSYYSAAFERAFLEGWDWASSQGIRLTLWLAASAIVWEAIRHAPRLWRPHPERGAIMDRIFKEFVFGTAGTIAVFLVGAFIWFFVQDAPEQARLAKATVQRTR